MSAGRKPRLLEPSPSLRSPPDHGNIAPMSSSNGDRKNGVPATVTSIPLVDPHAPKVDPSIGDLVKDATAQVLSLIHI